MSKHTLETLASQAPDAAFDLPLPLDLTLRLTEHPTPAVLHNLAKLKKLGICTPEALLSLVGVAPIDPINLMGTLMHAEPTGWRFSALDFSMIRVLSRTAKQTVAAALHVDLMGSTVAGLALNQKGQLTIFKSLEVVAGPETLAAIQALCDATIAAAAREAHG